MTAIRTHVKLHKKATVTLVSPVDPSAVPTKPERCADKPTQLDTITKSALAHPTDNSHGITGDVRPLPPGNRHTWHGQKPPQDEVVYPYLVAVLRTYLRRERPPFCVCAIRIAQIRRCTHTSLVRAPSVISTGHLARATPLISTCKAWKMLLLMCAGSFSYVARPSSGA